MNILLFVRTIFSSNGLLFGLLTWCLLMPALALAAGFQINLVNTNSGLHLKATTVPAGRLVWLQGNQPDSVTNIVQIEGLPVVQHDFKLTGGTSAAFYRAAMLDSNYEREPIGSGAVADVAITTKGTIEIWGNNIGGTFGNGTIPQPYTNSSAAKAVACWVTGITTGTFNNGPGPVQQSSATDWVSVAEGRVYTLALKADGTLWGWGDDTYGELGHTSRRLIPILCKLVRASSGTPFLPMHTTALQSAATEPCGRGEITVIRYWG